MSQRELFEQLKPYIQSLIDSASVGTEEDDETPPIADSIHSAVLFQDNETGTWHRVFLWGGRMYYELAPSGDISTPPTVPPQPSITYGDNVPAAEDNGVVLDENLYILNTIK